MSETTDATGLVASVIDVVDELITNPDRDTIIAGLNAEIDLVQSRFTVLSAIRDSLIGEVEEELPLEQPDLTPTGGHGDLESMIVQYVSQHGPSKPKAIADAIGSHHTKVGRAVNASNSFAKDGANVVVKLS